MVKPELPEEPEFEYVIRDISLDDLVPLRMALSSALMDRAVPMMVVNPFVLAASEIMANLVNHGGGTCSYAKLELTEAGGVLVCQILDNSRPFATFAGQRAMSVERANVSGDDERGRGLGLIARVFPDHWYDPKSGEDPESLNCFGFRYPPRPSLYERPKVLVVEDEFVQRVLIRSVLEQSFQMETCGTAEEGYDLATSWKPDVILSDIGLPDADGLSFRRRLSESEETDGISFVFLTGEDHSETEMEASELGIDDYLVKPVNPARLRSVVTRISIRRKQLLRQMLSRFAKQATDVGAPNLPSEIADFRTALYSHVPEAGGGDVVVSQQVGDTHIILLADMLGHGIQAKLFGVTFLGHFRAICSALTMSDDVTATTIMNKLAEAFLSDALLMDTVASAQVVLLRDGGQVEIASAGHPLPIHVREPKRRLVPVGGELLGVSDTPEFDQALLVLTPGESLILFTDGLYEVGDTQKQRRESAKEFLDQLGDLFGKDAEQIIEQVSATHSNLIGDGGADDATLIVLQAKP